MYAIIIMSNLINAIHLVSLIFARRESYRTNLYTYRVTHNHLKCANQSIAVDQQKMQKAGLFPATAPQNITILYFL